MTVPRRRCAAALRAASPRPWWRRSPPRRDTRTGAVLSLLHRAGPRPRAWLGAVLTGGLAMTLADAPTAGLDISYPCTWSPVDGASDAIWHLAYGLVTYGVITCARGCAAASGYGRRGRPG